jgi:hypothetical protein
MKKFIVLFISIILLLQFVNATNWQRCVSSKKCYFPGIGPTYNCGIKCGFKNYRSSGSFKAWKTDIGYNSCFRKCCNDKDKGYCYKNDAAYGNPYW